MKKNLLVALMLLSLLGCATTKAPTIIYKDKPVPFYIVPHPPKVEKPDYEVNKLTKEQRQDYEKNPGIIIRAFNITHTQYKEYTKLLEAVVAKYEEMAARSDQKIKDLQEDKDNGPQAASNPLVESEKVESSYDGFIEQNLDHMMELKATEKDFKEIEEKSHKKVGEIQ